MRSNRPRSAASRRRGFPRRAELAGYGLTKRLRLHRAAGGESAEKIRRSYAVQSRHSVLNTPVIMAKLKLGFFITEPLSPSRWAFWFSSCITDQRRAPACFAIGLFRWSGPMTTSSLILCLFQPSGLAVRPAAI